MNNLYQKSRNLITNKRINVNDESIISGFAAQKSKQELPLSLTFKLRSEGQLKLQGDLSFWRGRKGRTWKKQLLYYRTEHTEDRQHSAVSQMNIFESILTPPDFQRRTTGPIFFSLFLLWGHSFPQSWKHTQTVWHMEQNFVFSPVLSSLSLLWTLHYQSISLTEKGQLEWGDGWSSC